MTTDPTGPAIRRLRQERGMTQRQVARGAKITPAMLSAYELNKRSPRIHTVCRIVDAMDATLIDLGWALDHVAKYPPA